MSPSTSTKAIPEFVINYVKHLHTQGVIPKREDIKLALKQLLTEEKNDNSDICSWSDINRHTDEHAPGKRF